MYLSAELQVLLEACKAVLLGGSTEALAALLQEKPIRWARLSKMAAYNGIRPVVYAAFKKVPLGLFPADVLENYRDFAFQQSIYQTLLAQETVRVLHLLQTGGVRVLPYKGSILNHSLYQNTNLREMGDIDVVVHPQDAPKGLKRLLADGYTFDLKRDFVYPDNQDELITNILSAPGRHEVTLRKADSGYELDFHWGLSASYYPYQIDTATLFEHTQKIQFQHTEIEAPVTDTVFLMMLVHHGGLEAWLRLKNLCDLAIFLKTRPAEYDWTTWLAGLEKAKLKRLFLWGVWLTNRFFSLPIPVALHHDMARAQVKNREEQAVACWEAAHALSKFWPKMQRLRVTAQRQDGDFSRIGFVKKYVKFHSAPDLPEPPRFITFPEQFVLLNFLSKSIKYLWRRAF